MNNMSHIRSPMLPEDEAALLDSIQKWLDKDVRPVVKHHDHGDIWPEAVVAQMTRMGLFGATIGEEYGGLGLPAQTYAKIVMMISSYWMALTGIFNSHLIMAACVQRHGTPAQKQRWLPRFATGEQSAQTGGNGTPTGPAAPKKCGRVVTERTRTFVDGHKDKDRFYANYNCNPPKS